MALGIYVTGTGFTVERYDSTLKELEEAGVGAPKGRISHTALESDGEISVFDIWATQADFDAFGETLVPILTGAGIEINAPMVMEVHNTIAG